MEVIHVTHPIAGSMVTKEPHVMAIGFFDGVHLGHQSLINEAKLIAKKLDVNFTAMTFDPHPNEVIKFEKNMQYITPLPSKIEKMAALGVKRLFIVSFDLAFASLSPSDFINQYILGLQARHIVVGFDFTFGRKAQGTVDYLKESSKISEFDVTIVSKKSHNDQKISSPMIRKLLREGNVQLIPDYLGEFYEIKGTIQQQNRQSHDNYLGCIAEKKFMLPAPGIYRVDINYGDKTWQGLLSRKNSSLEIKSENSWIPESGGRLYDKILKSRTDAA
ncbi:adenylyltransferase/cytidyltransferase family protein [Peribacillus sp. B-H-3]|jgi:riboflavin kinase / FMN adenylyltransferase|uniref:adenylyltransferase/cytidyltransferase family protein n=1 Tax=Peribacillus sp. B-H-3 TaxID=3400420 RepID=UPI003B018443